MISPEEVVILGFNNLICSTTSVAAMYPKVIEGPMVPPGPGYVFPITEAELLPAA